MGGAEGVLWNLCRLNNCEVFTLGVCLRVWTRGAGALAHWEESSDGTDWALRLPSPPRPAASCPHLSTAPRWPLAPGPAPGAACAAARKRGAGLAAPSAQGLTGATSLLAEG